MASHWSTDWSALKTAVVDMKLNKLKTAAVDMKLNKLNVDIASLQATRQSESRCLKKQNHTFFWHGNGSKERREHGV